MVGRIINKFKRIQERNRLKKRSQSVNWKEIPVVVFVSTGRTGTQFFADFFTNQSTQLLALHEPKPDLFDIGTNYYRGRSTEAETRTELSIARALYGSTLDSSSLHCYVESNWNLAPLLHVLPDFFGDFKLVHVVRDPRTYVPSAFGIKGSKRPIYAEYDARERLTAKDKPVDKYAHQWDNWGRFEKLCWHWKTYNSMIDDFAASHGQTLRIKFEDIFNEETNYSGIDQVLEFTELGQYLDNGVEAAKIQLRQKSNKTKTPVLGQYETWTDAQRTLFHELTDNLASRYNYAY